MTVRRRSNRHFGAALVAGALLASAATSSSAHAQPAKPAASGSAPDSVMAEARARFDEGIKQAEAGDHEGARLKFNQAWAIMKSPTILYNLARAEHLSGHPVEALEHYRAFARLPPDPKITDAQRQRAAESITELSRKVGQIEIEAPPGARTSVDGRAIEPGSTDPVPVVPGKHVVEAIADGKVKSVTVDCQAGTMVKARLVDDDPLSAAPETTGKPPAKRGMPEAPADGALPQDGSPTFWTGGRITGLGLFAGGLAALGAGAAFHVAAGTAADEAEAVRSRLPEPRSSACRDQANDVTCAELRTIVEDQHARERLRTGLFIGGGALVVGGAVLFVVSSPKRGAERTGTSARVVPFATARDAGLTVVGRF